MRVPVLALFLAVSAHAQERDAPRAELARVGPVAGVFVGAGSASAIGPDFGLRGGVRVRLARYVALSFFGDLQIVPSVEDTWCPTFPRSGLCQTRTYFAPLATGVARIEFVNDGMIGRAFVPRFTLGAFAGLGALWLPRDSPIPAEGPFAMKTYPLFRGGLHLGLTRLPDDGWWFPVFLDAGVYGSPGASPGFYFLAGIGL